MTLERQALPELTDSTEQPDPQGHKALKGYKEFKVLPAQQELTEPTEPTV